MPWNLGIIDTKPRNLRVLDIKPSAQQIRVGIENRVYQQTLTAGMYMGIPPFTYPTQQVVDTPFSP